MSDADVMQLADVRFAYHGVQYVIDGVSAPVKRGCLHMLIGPNASGKSTLIKMMLGLLRPASGRIMIDDTPVDHLPASQRAAWISYVPQRSSASFSFSVRHVVAMGRYALRSDPQAVEQAIESCDLSELTDRPYTELSVGQQQRVLLARAMAQSSSDGRLMLLDEPTSAMDLAHVHRTMQHLRDLAERGPAVVVVVQDLNLAARYADHVWLMDAGRLAAGGEWSAVLQESILEPVYAVQLVRTNAKEGEATPQRPRFDVRLPPAADGG